MKDADSPLGRFGLELLDELSDGAYCVDRERRIQTWNPAAERLTGFRRDEVVGRRCADNILRHVDERGTALCRAGCPLSHTMGDGEPRHARVFFHHKDGHRVPVSVRCSPLRDEGGAIVGAVELFSDASAVEALEQRLRELESLAYIDHTTGIANRRHLEQALDVRLHEWQRFEWPCGVLMADIDSFKAVNDRWGHVVGDRVLRMVAHTLVANVRPFDLVGRWGGEEFLALLRNVEASALERVAERLRVLVEASFLAEGSERLGVTVSIGGTLVRQGDGAESVVKRADAELYEAKAAGKNVVRIGEGGPASERARPRAH